MASGFRYMQHQTPALSVWLLSVAILALLLYQAPPWLKLQRINITLNNGESIVLGKTELAAAAAANHHMRIGRDHRGWWIQNISAEHKLLIGNKTLQPVRRWQLAAGDRIQVAQQQLTIRQIQGSELLLERLQSRSQHQNLYHQNHNLLRPFRYQQRRLYQTGLPLPLCHEAGSPDTITQLKALTRIINLPGLSTHSLTLGGMADCGTNISLTDTPYQALQLHYENKAWHLQPGQGFNLLDTSVRIIRQGKHYDLRNLHQRLFNYQEHDSLADTVQLIAGYSRFQLQKINRGQQTQIQLIPLHRSQRVLKTPQLSSYIEQHWLSTIAFTDWKALPDALSALTLNPELDSPDNRMSGWGILVVIIILPTTFICLLLWSLHHPAHPARYQSVRLALLGTLTSGSLLPLIVSLPAWFSIANLLLAGLIWALQPVRSAQGRNFRLLTLTLLMVGTLTQLQLALGAAQSHWIQHAIKTAALCSTTCWAIQALAVWQHCHKPTLQVLEIRWRWLMSLTLSLLVLQWLAGYEGGLGPFQPVELAKTVLIMITAAALTRRLDLLHRDYYIGRLALWSNILWATLLFLAVFFILLIQLNDHSPIVLMAFWASSMVAMYSYLAMTHRAYYSAPPHPGKRTLSKKYPLSGLLAPALLLTGLVFASLERNNLQHMELLPQNDRFRVWAQPELHPHSGYQFRTAQSLLINSGPQSHYLDTLFNQQPYATNGDAMSVPAVQDDFMPSFFIYQSGALLTAGLVILQYLLIYSLIRAGLNFRRHHQQAHYCNRAQGNFICLVLTGGAGMLLGHFIVSWGSNLGFLPVMGQPMPLLSSAGSNLILFCSPLLAAAYLSAKGDTYE
ncbi:MAG: FtsW/RodA/SpoVE family cell cycle protein [Marinobacterium sp.]|nr:FtsW/RodA/SpoVE family cell cycle protein [Marinobacterium sp.]